MSDEKCLVPLEQIKFQLSLSLTTTAQAPFDKLTHKPSTSKYDFIKSNNAAPSDGMLCCKKTYSALRKYKKLTPFSKQRKINQRNHMLYKLQLIVTRGLIR